MSVDFDQADSPTYKRIPRAGEEVALSVFHMNHGSIINTDSQLSRQNPNHNGDYADWERLLLASLNVEPDTYSAHRLTCTQKTERTYAEGLAKDDSKHQLWYHRYQHVVFRVRDQFDQPVEDYFIEFYQQDDDPTDIVFKKLQSEVLEDVHVNSVKSNYRSFYFDIDDLDEFLAEDKDRSVRLSIHAADLSSRIHYRNPGETLTSGIPVFQHNRSDFRFPLAPVLVDIRLHREPSAEVFKLRKY
jgi:hypothetical protein